MARWVCGGGTGVCGWSLGGDGGIVNDRRGASRVVGRIAAKQRTKGVTVGWFLNAKKSEGIKRGEEEPAQAAREQRHPAS